MRRLKNFLRALNNIKASKGPSNRSIQVIREGDKVKKKIYTGYTPPGQPRREYEEYIYGKVLHIENDYAYVQYKSITIKDSEKLSDLEVVSEQEWRLVFRS